MSTGDVFDQLESNVQSYARAYPATFDRARGAEIWDVDGRRYLDFLAGAGTLNYGHNDPVLKAALIEYIERDAITHSLDFHTTAKREFLEAIRDIIFEPRGLDYVVQFTGPTGTNAVDAALKIARKVTSRTNVVSFTNAFHGVTVGSLSVTGSGHHRRGAGIPLDHATRMPYDGYFGPEIDTIAYLDKMLGDPSSGIDQPAAVILETVQGEGGLNVAGFDWLRRLREVCTERDILLIIDDIQAGCGRTGTFFSFEPAGIVPDIVTMSKSISGYGLPFALVFMRPWVDRWSPGEHNGTFRGNNHAFVTARRALEHYWSSDEFMASVHDKAETLEDDLHDLLNTFSPQISEIRGRGMMRGVVLADPAAAARVTARAFELGLIIERSGPYDEVIKLLTPLTIEADELDEGLAILRRCLREEFDPAGSTPVDSVTAKSDTSDSDDTEIDLRQTALQASR